MMIFIKNMVCARCITAVAQELEKLKLQAVQISMGEVVLKTPATSKQLSDLDQGLKAIGFELLDNRKQKQIENIKTLLIEKVQSGEIEERFVLSEFLSEKLKMDYSHISRLFSDVEGITIEQYFILQKIEKIKEWIAYDELTLSEIAWKLGYSSLAHLSAQFKKVTGLTPSHVKKIGSIHRLALDQVKRK